MLVDLYRRWLFEVWDAGRYAVADGCSRRTSSTTTVAGQPAGRAGDVWAADMVRTAFPDAAFTLDVAFEAATSSRAAGRCPGRTPARWRARPPRRAGR
jgi:hypothetical protein